MKTDSSEVSVVEVQQEEVGREFPAEYSQVEEDPGEVRDTSRLLQNSRRNTFRRRCTSKCPDTRGSGGITRSVNQILSIGGGKTSSP